MKVFAFLDVDHPPVAWAVMRGMLFSADHAHPTQQFGFISFMQAGLIEHQNNPRLHNELVIEFVRKASFTRRTSRLGGMYFFLSGEDAERRIEDPDWPPYFRRDRLLELELHSPDTSTIVDANWITFAPHSPDGRLSTHALNWIARYWAGEPFNELPVWELIAGGVAVVLDSDVRRRCFELMKDTFPSAHIPILMSRLAGEAGTRGGLTAPFLLRHDAESILLGYLWSDAEFHDPMVIRRIAEHPDSRFLGRLMGANETWNMPDFRPWSRVFRVGRQCDPEAPEVLTASVHHTIGQSTFP